MTPQSQSLLEQKLPLHILECISSHLDQQSTASFSLVNKHCSLAAARSRFRFPLRLEIKTPEKLLLDVQELDKILRPGNRYRHVRWIVMWGSMDPANWLDDDIDDGIDDIDDRISEVKIQAEEELADEDMYSLPARMPSHNYKLYTEPPLTGEERDAQDKAWSPVARFISGLIGLHDIMYGCDDQVPRCILNTLHAFLPRCRLRLHDFSLRSLYQPPHQLTDVDHDEYALATSPALHGVFATVTSFTRDGRLGYNYEALQCMASGLAPNLRHIYIRLPESAAPPLQPEKPPFTFFQSSDKTNSDSGYPSTSNGRLQSLAFESHHHPISPTVLLSWAETTDFSQLRFLSIEGDKQVPIETLNTMTQLASNGEFRSLRALHLRSEPPTYTETIRDAYDTATGRFLTFLPPLSRIKLERCIHHATFSAILTHHGTPTLRHLHFHHISHPPTPSSTHFFLSSTRLSQLQALSPNLESISLPIYRTQGSPEEVSIYRALGRMSRLKYVFLYLNCADGPYHTALLQQQNPNTTDEPPPPRFNPRDFLISAATDAALATTIFNLIFPRAAATETTPDRALLDARYELQFVPTSALNLRRIPAYAHLMSDEAAHRASLDLGNWMARKWGVCGRVDRRSGLLKRKIVEFDQWERERAGEQPELDDALEVWGEAWEELWPSGGEGGDGGWRHAWRSFPLVMGG